MSDDLVLNTEINLVKLFEELVFLDHENAILRNGLQQASAELAVAISRNASNSALMSKHQLQLSEASLRISDVNRVAVAEYKKVVAFDFHLTVLEAEAQEHFAKISDFMSKLSRVTSSSNNLEASLVEADVNLNFVEREIYAYQASFDSLDADLRDMEFALGSLEKRISAIQQRTKPSLDSLLELRTIAAKARADLSSFVTRLKRIEILIMGILMDVNTLDENRA
jgi:chromosome segregation ATPase